MKYNYTNILPFSLSLYILLLESHVYNQRNHYITLHKPNKTPIKPHRSLCECELYSSIYENDPEMKAVMQNFNGKTSERFKEYDERMKKNRQKCKKQCDKDIQKIILKDKIEKELSQHLSTLETDIDTNEIPTCVCEKSLADKTEKFCYKCGYGLGGGGLQSFSLLGGISEVALNAWKTGALLAAKKAAMVEGAAAGLKEGHAAGVAKVLEGLKTLGIDDISFGSLGSFINTTNYMNETLISGAVQLQYSTSCRLGALGAGTDSFCTNVDKFSLVPGIVTEKGLSTEESIKLAVKGIVLNAKNAADAKSGDVASTTFTQIINERTGLIQAEFNCYITSIYASIIAILIIILVMVIIYLILRYRRRKKMKKKLQYIKLLKQ
ncbi:PIR protein [Plasmodium sp. gorilla clade G1]|nr:PIR protein [Plasmodium sp. gorilla clade G1]